MNLPSNVESEKVVLNKLLKRDSKATDSLLDYDESFFFEETHKNIFRKIIADIHEGTDFDELSLHLYLQDDKNYLESGGREYLKSLYNDYDFNFRTHFDSARAEYFKRARLELHAKSQLAIIENKENLGKLLEEYEFKIFELNQKLNQKRNDLESASEISDGVISALDLIMNAERKYLGIPTGFQLLDETTLGLHNSDVTIFAARASSGKSSFFGSIIDNHIVSGSKIRIFVFSLEMSKDQLIQRLIASIGRIPLQNIRRGNLSEYEWARFLYALDLIKDAELYIDDTPSITTIQLENKIRSAIAKGLVPDLVVVDYLQLMTPTRITDSIAADTGTISRGLKLIAKSYNLPLFALSQLSRSPDKRLDHRPTLSDLRNSGAIEQDADNILFLYRDELYNPTTENKGLAEIIVAKQRMGPLATIPLGFIPHLTKFVNVLC